eukprot:g15074.t1 g15074   contig21:491999-494559(-)
MAEQVQAVLERMVAPLKDLRDRGIFSEEEIRAIVNRRRQSEYLLQRRGTARQSDYLRYIEQEILLEKLRKLRKQKVMQEQHEERRRRRLEGLDDSDNDDDGENDDGTSNQGRKNGKGKKKHAYQSSGPGDSHIISHIHFLYQRLLKKFHYPVEVIVNYAAFAREHKSFHVMSRVYAEGLQHHPREEGLWIEAASFEFFGHIAQDNERSETTKLVGSSIQNARVLMQRGLRINGKTSQELWLQYFALEMHYVQKLRGRREILEGAKAKDDASDEDGDEDSEGERGKVTSVSNSMLLPSQIIYKNAIKSIPDNIQFRLRFIETCRQFPQTSELERYIMESVESDFGESVEGWVARISYGEEKLRRRIAKGKGGGGQVGFLANADDESGEDEGEDRPRKKARVAAQDPALILLDQALEAVPTAKMYLEGARYLRLRIQRLVGNTDDDEEEEDDVSYLMLQGEDVQTAVQRHVGLLDWLYSKATENGISSTSLTLDQVDFLLSDDEAEKAEKLLCTVSSSSDANAQLYLRWAQLSRELEASGVATSSSPERILRYALEATPIHNRSAYLLILTELMQTLMMQTRSTKRNEELKALLQKLLLLSQGVADNDAVRSIYTGALFNSNYGKSCVGKSSEEISAMKSFFDTCLHFERSIASTDHARNKKDMKNKKKLRLCKLYESAVAFFESIQGGAFRRLVDEYQRGLDDVKYGL